MTESSSETDPTPDDTFSDTMPPPVPWAPAAVRLLQGIVYHDDAGDRWERILSGVTPLTDYFARIGLQLIVNEEDGMAYRAVDLMSRTALAAVSQTPTGANAHRLIVVTRYTTKSTRC